MKLYNIDSPKTVKYLSTERGISYFEDGWWMFEEDRLKANKRIGRPMRRNEETKQITIDNTIYPCPI